MSTMINLFNADKKSTSYIIHFKRILFTDFHCKHWLDNTKYKKKKICVPKKCDTNYNCPHPFECSKEAGKCVRQNESNKCTENKGIE